MDGAGQMMERTREDDGIERYGAEREEIRLHNLDLISPRRFNNVGVRINRHDRMRGGE